MSEQNSEPEAAPAEQATPTSLVGTPPPVAPLRRDVPVYDHIEKGSQHGGVQMTPESPEHK